MSSRAGKLVSPAGLVLVLLCFLLPFVTVSCESAVIDYEATYRGTDFVVGGDPDVTVSGPGVREGQDRHGHVGPQVLAILAVLAVLAGIVAAVLPYARLSARPTSVRPIATAAATAVALLLLVGNQLVVTTSIVDKLQRANDGEIGISRSTAEDMVDSRFGFWLACALLIAVIAYSVIDISWPKLKAKLVASQQQQPPPQSWPGIPPPPEPPPSPPPGPSQWQPPPR